MFWFSSRFILMTFLLSALAGVITVQKYQIEKLRIERDTAQQNHVEKDIFIQALHQQIRTQEAAQQRLQKESAQIRLHQMQREAAIKRTYETRLVHHWADTRLPESIIRMLQHDTFSGASAYVQHVPHSQPVHIPRRCAHNERGTPSCTRSRQSRVGGMCGASGHDSRLSTAPPRP